MHLSSLLMCKWFISAAATSLILKWIQFLKICKWRKCGSGEEGPLIAIDEALKRVARRREFNLRHEWESRKRTEKADSRNPPLPLSDEIGWYWSVPNGRRHGSGFRPVFRRFGFRFFCLWAPSFGRTQLPAAQIIAGSSGRTNFFMFFKKKSKLIRTIPEYWTSLSWRSSLCNFE